MAQKVMTAPLAVIYYRNQVIGKMKNLRITETIRRGRVSGLGKLLPDELPALEWNGTLNAGFYSIDLVNTGITGPGSTVRNTNDVEVFVNNVLLQEEGVDLYIYKKVPGTVNPDTGVIESIEESPWAIIRGGFVDREGMDISEGQIAGRDQDFTYLTPILYDPAIFGN